MRIFLFFLFAIITTALIIILNSTLLLPAPLGKLLSPQHGIWQNAEDEKGRKDETFSFPQLADKVEVFMDDRMVPHVFAANENDAYFVQGYLHAKYRLWQMEFQAMAAGGELSKLVGEVALNRDREFRRLGMVYAAEKARDEMEKDPVIKAECDAYTAGVNEYIKTLTAASLPLEYKLLGYAPTPWTTLKTALFLKYMSYDLASAADDLEMTNARAFFTKEQFDLLYPSLQDSLDPIIPKETPFLPQSVFPKAPADVDSVKSKDFVINQQMQPDRENGSNNWAVGGSKTQTGAPILCNDPHLGLNLPSLWYEIQINTPELNVYGASFPGAPGVIIGFNDSCAFGFTNGGRDVRDYYEISFKDESRNEYLFNGTYQKTAWRIDTIVVKGKPNFIDSVAYVDLGGHLSPVMYDKTFTGNKNTGNKNLAVRWTAHDVSNELRVFNGLNHAKNYSDYVAAAESLHTPGQNIVFAAKNGDIALRTQGDWPAKWMGQGDFIMPGVDSSYLWQGMIPQNEVPYQYNPERGFVSSANQKPVAETYHYYMGRSFPEYRGLTINRLLAAMDFITVDDMKRVQTSAYDGLAAMVLPKILFNLDPTKLTTTEKAYYDTLARWDYNCMAMETAPTLYHVLWRTLKDTIYSDEFLHAPLLTKTPFESTLAETILRDSNSIFYDDHRTEQIETLEDNVLAAFKKMSLVADNLKKKQGLAWYKYNNVRVVHLARLPAFSIDNVKANGGRNAINANHGTHGPSWRMIVSLTPETEAWGIYPGGQSGNPGSRYYSDFVPDWAAEKYYRLWVMRADEKADKKLIKKMTFFK